MNDRLNRIAFACALILLTVVRGAFLLAVALGLGTLFAWAVGIL